MTAAVTNPFKLTWGSFVIGGTTERLIAGITSQSETFTDWSLTLDVFFRGTSDADFATNVAEMESEFTKRRQRILWEVGTETLHDLNPATYSGLNTYAQINKPGTPGADTDRSRMVSITVGGGKPAGDADGRLNVDMRVDYSPARQKTVTFTGEWTADVDDALAARAQYEAKIAAYCSSALSGAFSGVTFEAVPSETVTSDDQDAKVTFSRVYKEIVVNQPSGSPDFANIVEPSLSLSRSIEHPGDSGGGNVRRLTTISATFSCWLDMENSTDLESLYTTTVLPFIDQAMQDRYSPSQWARVLEQPRVIPYTNMLEVNVTYQAAIDATDVIESTETVRIAEGTGVILTPAWTGGIFDKYVDQGHATKRRFSIQSVRVLGTLQPQGQQQDSGPGFAQFQNPGGGDAFGAFGNVPGFGQFQNPGGGNAFGAFGVIGGGGRWVLIDEESSATPKWLGLPGGDQIAVTDMVNQKVEEWVTEPPAGGGGAGQGDDGGGGGQLPNVPAPSDAPNPQPTHPPPTTGYN
jgi:hypothetical protein